MIKPWLLDEVAHAGPEHLDAGVVAAYDQKQGYPDPAEDLAVFAEHGLNATATVVDLGAGTGQFAIPAADRFRQVIAVDVSGQMLEVLRRRVAQTRVSNIAVVQAGFLTYEHEGPPADGAYSRNALHHLPDFWKALALHRIAEMLRPGGVLRIRDLIYDFPPPDAPDVIDNWMAGAVSNPAVGYTCEDYAEHVRTEHSTFRWLFEPMLVAAGFAIVTADYQRRIFGAYTCVRR